MAAWFRRHFFMGMAALGLAAMALFVVIGELLPDGGGDGPPGAAAKGGPPGGGPGGGGPGGGGPGGGGRPTAVAVDTAALRPFVDRIEAIGTAQANESVNVTAKVSDVVTSIRFDSGQRVAAGQILVTLANTEQRGDVSGAQGDLSAVRAQVVEAEAAAREAQLSLQRQTELAARGFASPARLDQAKAAAESAKARVDAARQRLNAAEGRVTAIEARASDRVIRAPFAGVVGLRNISVGQLARPGDVLATLDDVSTIKIDFAIPETFLQSVRPGTVLKVRADALGDAPVIEAPIRVIDSRINPATRTFQARAVVTNPAGALKPGMLVNGVVDARPRQAVAVPEIALFEEGEQSYVFLVARKGDGPPRAERLAVTVGVRRDGYAEITSGLAAGATVITEGLVRLRPGAPVRILGEERPSAAASGRPGPPAGAPAKKEAG